jgi:ankyrin repeat protein
MPIRYVMGAILATLCLQSPSWSASAIADAAQSQNREELIRLIGQGGDVNAPQPDKTTALHWAAHYNDSEMVGRLIKAGAHADVANDYGSTPLCEAAASANTDIIEKLLAAGAKADTANAEGETALLLVARSNNVKAARLLIQHGANVNAVEQFRGQTALIRAAAESQAAMVKELIALGADVNARSTPNHWQRQVSGEPRALHRPVGGLTPLLYASREGCLACVENLVAGGADLNLPDPDGITPLIMAIQNAHFDTAAILLEKGANPNQWDWYGRTPLYEAVDENTIPHGGRPDRPSLDKITSLKMIELLLAAGANPNAQLKLLPPLRKVLDDRFVDAPLTIGATPLLRAAKAMDAPVIAMLLKAGARVDLGNYQGYTPILVAAGVGSNDADTRGWFVTEDVQARSIATLNLLLQAGADINASGGRRNQTPLHGAAFWGWNDVVQFLVDHGGKLDAKDSEGKTVIDAAMGRAGGNSRGGQRIDLHKDTAALLQKLGAR